MVSWAVRLVSYRSRDWSVSFEVCLEGCRSRNLSVSKAVGILRAYYSYPNPIRRVNLSVVENTDRQGEEVRGHDRRRLEPRRRPPVTVVDGVHLTAIGECDHVGSVLDNNVEDGFHDGFVEAG